MYREPGAAAERDDRRKHVQEDAERPASFSFVVIAFRHPARDTHRRRGTAPHGGIARRRRRSRWRGSVLLGGGVTPESRAAEIANQLARLSLAAAYGTL